MLTNLLLGQTQTTQLPMALGVTLVFVVIVLFSMLLLVLKQYKRCPSNRVLVIYGGRLGKSAAAKTIHGGSAFVMPLIQDYAYLNLEQSQIEVPLRGLRSAANL